SSSSTTRMLMPFRPSFINPLLARDALRRRMGARNALGTAGCQVGTGNIHSGSDGFLFGRSCRGFTRRNAVKFNAHVAVGARESGGGIDYEPNQRGKSHTDKDLPSLRHQ